MNLESFLRQPGVLSINPVAVPSNVIFDTIAAPAAAAAAEERGAAGGGVDARLSMVVVVVVVVVVVCAALAAGGCCLAGLTFRRKSRCNDKLDDAKLRLDLPLGGAPSLSSTSHYGTAQTPPAGDRGLRRLSSRGLHVAAV